MSHEVMKLDLRMTDSESARPKDQKAQHQRSPARKSIVVLAPHVYAVEGTQLAANEVAMKVIGAFFAALAILCNILVPYCAPVIFVVLDIIYLVSGDTGAGITYFLLAIPTVLFCKRLLEAVLHAWHRFTMIEGNGLS